MSDSAFRRSLTFVLAREGGATITNDPHDPGGLTRFGVSKRSYPMLDIEHLTLEQASEIYRRDYWQKAGCDQLPEPVALVLFDAAVNQGVVPALRLLQLCLGVTVDGSPGPNTARAAAERPIVGTIFDYVCKRWDRYHDTGGAGIYLRGWTRRLFAVQQEALLLAALKEF
jgi:lysozyme family protein